MADSEDDDWPGYPIGPTKHIHALGVMAMNFSFYEAALALLFDRFVHKPVSEYMFYKMDNNERTGLIQQFFKTYERDPEVIAAVDHLIRHFSICAENRHILMHSKEHFAVSRPNLLSLEKAGKRDFTINVFHLTLTEVRRAADQTRRGITYLLDIWYYLHQRDDFPPGEAPPFLARALPKKLPLPRKLEPHRPAKARSSERRQPRSSRS